MPGNSFAKWVVTGISLALLQPGSAGADEIWKCAFTESRLHMPGRDVLLADHAPFFIQIKSAVINLVVYGAATHTTFIPISYVIAENTPAVLRGVAHFDLGGGTISTGNISLEKRNGHVVQTGDESNSDRRQISVARCSRSSIDLKPLLTLAPSANTTGAPPRMEAPVPQRLLVRKRHA